MACGAEKEDAAGLRLVLDTDMAVPENVNHVGLYVQYTSGGRTQMLLSKEEAPIYDEESKTRRVSFAATLSIQGNEATASDRVRARFIAFDRTGAPLAMREMATGVPTLDVRVVRLPLLYLNSGKVLDTQPGVATNGAGLDLQQAEGERGDVFTRYRMRDCAENETLNDVGACESIDLDPNGLPSWEDFKESLPKTCIQPTACFADGRGVRELKIENCIVHVPANTAVGKPALALGVDAAYEVDGSDKRWQPVDGNLYEYDGSKIVLGKALCERAQGVTEVRVSARCTAKETLEPICGDQRGPLEESDSIPPPRTPDPQARIEGDTPDPDWDGGTDANEGLDGDLDGGGDNVEPWEVFLNGFDNAGDVVSFAVTPDLRHLWTLTNSEWRVSSLNPNEILNHANQLPSGDLAPRHIELGIEVGEDQDAGIVQGYSAYFLPTDYGYAYRVLPGQHNAIPLSENCGFPFDESLKISLGRLHYTEAGTKSTTVVGVFSDAGTYAVGSQSSTFGCLSTNKPMNVDAIPPSGRGTELNGKWYVPSGRGLYEIGQPFVDNSPTYKYVATDVLATHFIAISDNEALLVANGANGTTFHLASPSDGGFITEKLGVSLLEQTTRETFGGGHKWCGQVISATGARALHCYEVASGQAHDITPSALTNSLLGQTRVFGDENRVYFAYKCEGGLRVRSVGWKSLSSSLDLTCPLDADAGDGSVAPIPTSTSTSPVPPVPVP